MDRIFPNRFNPNEMDVGMMLLLDRALEEDEYDPIIISPMNVFYRGVDLDLVDHDRGDGVVVNLGAIVSRGVLNPADSYVICDGEHRYKRAKKFRWTTIRVVVWSMTEKDAMPYFYKRHKVHGEFDPLKEAELFQHESVVNGLTLVEIAKKYNLHGKQYIHNRLKLLQVSASVMNLFYEPPEGSPGRLSITHLRVLSFLPKGLQKPVALMSLERNWTSKDIEAEVRRIKEGKGIRGPTAKKEAPDEPPPPRIEDEDKPELDEKPLVPEEVLFEEYPEEFLVEETDEPEPPTENPILEQPNQEPEQEPEALKDSAYEEPSVEPTLPPLVVNRDLLEPFIEAMLVKAAIEGLDLNRAENAVLTEELDEAAYQFFSKAIVNSLPTVALKSAQLWIKSELERGRART